MTVAGERLILTSAEAADYASVHRDTILRALQAGELHGLQKRVKSHWRIRVTCLESWLDGQRCDHQKSKAA